jgi:copper chaperone NosL
MAGCNGGPRPLVAGQDACDFCRMMITDARFGGELVTRTGRVRTFDSIECLASYVSTAGDTAGMRGLWVADYASKRLIPAESARYLLAGKLHAPMGRDIVSFAPAATAGELERTYGGKVISWREVVTLVRSRGDSSAGAPNDVRPHSDSGAADTPDSAARKS